MMHALYIPSLCHRQLVVSIPVRSVISVMVGNFDCKHSCLVEKNVLPSRWQDGAESLGIRTTSRLRYQHYAEIKHSFWLEIV